MKCHDELQAVSTMTCSYMGGTPMPAFWWLRAPASGFVATSVSEWTSFDPARSTRWRSQLPAIGYTGFPPWFEQFEDLWRSTQGKRRTWVTKSPLGHARSHTQQSPVSLP